MEYDVSTPRPMSSGTSATRCAFAAQVAMFTPSAPPLFPPSKSRLGPAPLPLPPLPLASPAAPALSSLPEGPMLPEITSGVLEQAQARNDEPSTAHSLLLNRMLILPQHGPQSMTPPQPSSTLPHALPQLFLVQPHTPLCLLPPQVSYAGRL